MKILAIETSCDETSIALLKAQGRMSRTSKPEFKVYSNLIASQIDIHKKFGGVVPNLAKREHLKNLPLLLKKISSEYELNKIDAVAVTVGPGLEPALWTGINFAKDLAKKLNKPLIGANHLEGHLYSPLLPHKRGGNKQIKYPSIALIVSGGHTILLLLKSLTEWKKIGETRDDAAGEAYDKVARLLGLPYPGGPEIERLAKSSKLTRSVNSGLVLSRAEGLTAKSYINFPRPMIHQKNYDFSFSGLKTSVLYHLRDLGYYTHSGIKDSRDQINDTKLISNIAASFQEAAIEVLVKKTIRAAKEFRAKSIFLSGGVASNKALRAALKREAHKLKIDLLVPEFEFNTDNAAMIGAAAYINILDKSKNLRGKIKSKYKIAAQGNLNL